MLTSPPVALRKGGPVSTGRAAREGGYAFQFNTFGIGPETEGFQLSQTYFVSSVALRQRHGSFSGKKG